MSGITTEGFSAKTLQELKTEIEEDQLATISPSLILSADQPIGQINGIFAAKLAECWEVLQVAYNAIDRNSAEGRLLDNIGALTGTPREPARKSLVTCEVTVDGTFSSPAAAGTLMAHVTGEPTIRFVNRDQVISTGAGTYDVVFESTVYGPVAANAGTIEEITAPVTGWTAITNPEDAVPGSVTETDAPYRVRQRDELTATGACTVDAIRADLLAVDGVDQAFCFENVTLETDENGLPGKAIECVVYDGAVPAADDDEIAQAIWESKGSGVETYGSESGTAVDALGDDRVMNFSRATIKTVYLVYTIVTDPSTFPVGGSTAVKEAAVALGNTLNLGEDVIALDLKACVRERFGGVIGVLDVTSMTLGFTAVPVGTTNLTVSGRELARFDTTRVTVNVT